MLYWSEFVGATVISKERKIGHMENMMLDPDKKMITGLMLERRNRDLHYRYVLFNRIKEINRNLIIMKEPAEIKFVKRSDKERMILAGDIINHSILDDKGGWIGRVVDFSFDPTNGIVREMVVSESILDDLWRGRKKMPVLSQVEFSRELVYIDQDTREEIYGMDKGLRKWLRTDKA